MARIKALDYEDKQRVILKQAAMLFAERGYDNTSLDDIALASSMKKSSLYHYHDSKHAILLGVISEKINDLIRKVEEEVERAATPRERFKAVVAALVTEYIRVPHEVTVLLTQTRHLDQDAFAAVSELQHRLINRVVLILIQLRPGASQKRDRLTAQAMLLFGMTNWIHVWYKPGGSVKPDVLIELITGTFLDGYLNTV